jgi:hypothetical protein
MQATEMPALTGTEKQIAWASEVRPQAWAEIERFAAEMRARNERTAAIGRVPAETLALREQGLAILVEQARTTADAGRWIEARNKSGGQALWAITCMAWDAKALWYTDPATRSAVLSITDSLR